MRSTKKIISKIFAVMLSAVLALGIAGCGDDGKGNNGNKDIVPSHPVTEEELFVPVNGLHEISVTESNRTFISGGASEYKIVVGSEDPYQYAQKAANFIGTNIYRATQVNLEIVTEGSGYNADGKRIYVGATATFEAAKLSLPAEDLGVTGYYVKSLDNSVFIESKDPLGLQYGAIAFLRAVMGYEMYAGDCVVYKKSGNTLPDMEIIERPDIDFHAPSDQMDAGTRYGMGFLSPSDPLISVGTAWHNSMDYLPADLTPEQSAAWISNKTGVMGGQTIREICYTAHGNEELYDELIELYAQTIVDAAIANPTKTNIAIFMEDSPSTQCNCAACQAVLDKYGVYSAAVIQFCNKVNRSVRAKFEALEMEDRKLTIAFAAYYYMEKPPVKKAADGSWEPIDESVTMDEDLAVWIAPINASYNESFYHEKNKSTKETFDQWGAIANQMFVWLYNTNYHHYLYPHNSYDTVYENYRYLKGLNAVYLWTEGQHNQAAVTHFSRLKEYLNSKTMINVNENLQDLTDDFFANYFMDAAEPMRKFYNELRAQLRLIESQNDSILGGIYEPIDDAKFWPFSTLMGWMSYIDEAYRSIERYRTENSEIYEMLYEHILLESIFPRFAILDHYSASFDSATLQEMRSTFREDCIRLKISNYNENSITMDSIFEGWGV